MFSKTIVEESVPLFLLRSFFLKHDSQLFVDFAMVIDPYRPPGELHLI